MNTTTNAEGLRRLGAPALCGLLALSFTALLATADSLAPLKVRVPFGDLDPSGPQGAAVLYGRIRLAAEKVCSPLETGGLAAQTRLNACINKAISKAVTKVDQPALSHINSATAGTSLSMRLASLLTAEVHS